MIIYTHFNQRYCTLDILNIAFLDFSIVQCSEINTRRFGTWLYSRLLAKITTLLSSIERTGGQGLCMISPIYQTQHYSYFHLKKKAQPIPET
jgi:hypothetical protein